MTVWLPEKCHKERFLAIKLMLWTALAWVIGLKRTQTTVLEEMKRKYTSPLLYVGIISHYKVRQIEAYLKRRHPIQIQFQEQPMSMSQYKPFYPI